MKMILFILVLLWASTALSHTILLKENVNTKEYIIHYSDNDKWIVDKYLEQNNNLQERLVHKIFNSLEPSQKFIDSISHSFKKIELIPSLTPTVSARKSSQVIWEAHNSWNEEWETRFTDWLRQEFHPDFFVDYNIATDCADAAYATRWIFARTHSLPASAQLAGSNRLVTNETMHNSWSALPRHANWWEDQVFMAAINYVMNNTYTHTLKNDSFPVQINSTHFTPGLIYLTLNRLSGHTRLINRVGPSKVITMLSSTVPRSVRALSEEGFFPSINAEINEGGLVKFRWLERDGNNWQLKAKTQMPGYSLEQFEDEFSGKTEAFHRAVKKRLFGDSVDQDYADANLFIETIKAQATERIGIVEQGHSICSANYCKPGSPNYENWSTPSRDQRLQSYFNQLATLGKYSTDRRVIQLIYELSRLYKLNITNGVSLSWDFLSSAFQYANYSSDPNDSILKRWGIMTADNFQVETAHPYRNNNHQFWSLFIPTGFSAVLHFDIFDLEQSYDWFRIKDTQGREFSYTGTSRYLTTDVLHGGGIIELRFTSDLNYSQQGLRLKEIELIATSNVENSSP